MRVIPTIAITGAIVVVHELCVALCAAYCGAAVQGCSTLFTASSSKGGI
jgi:membrane-associated protease RseP (regulator of RpoE activity)